MGLVGHKRVIVDSKSHLDLHVACLLAIDTVKASIGYLVKMLVCSYLLGLTLESSDNR